MHRREGPGWTLLQADYRETCAYVAEQGGADLFAFSPPYCDARTYGAAVSWGDADYAALGDAVFSALKPGGHALVNVDAPVREWRKGMGTERGFHPWRMMLDWAERVGFRVPDRLAFFRQGQPGRFPYFRNDWEPLLLFQRPGSRGFLDQRAIAQRGLKRFNGAVAVQVRNGSSRPKDKDGKRVGKTFGTLFEDNLRLPGTLWAYHAGATGAAHIDLQQQNHPARWPYRLAEDLVRCFCPPGGLVVDPFVGAGTTAAAAIAWDRRFIGGDLFARQDDGKPWVDVAAHVLTERQRQRRMFG